MLKYIKDNKFNLLVYVIIVALFGATIFYQKKNNSKLETKNKGLEKKVDSLNTAKEITDKIVELNTEILKETNKDLIKKKDEIEAKISALDSADLEYNYEQNLLTIKEYVEDLRAKSRKR